MQIIHAKPSTLYKLVGVIIALFFFIFLSVVHWLSIGSPEIMSNTLLDTSVSIPVQLQVGEHYEEAIFPTPADGLVPYSINNEIILGCIYSFYPSPLLGMRPGDEFTVVYADQTTFQPVLQTQYLVPPYAYAIDRRIINWFVALMFFLTSVLATFSVPHKLSRRELSGLSLVNLNFLFAALAIIGVNSIGANKGWGSGIGAMAVRLATLASIWGYSRWPVDISDKRIIKFLKWVSVPVVVVSVLTSLATSKIAGCNYHHLEGVWSATYIAAALLLLINSTAPLAIGAKETKDQLLKTQIVSLLWGTLIGMGLLIILSLVPDLLGFPLLPAHLAVAIIATLPISHMVVTQQTGILKLEAYTVRVLIRLAYLALLAGITFFAIQWIEFTIPDPPLSLVGFVAVVPIFLFFTVLQKPMQSLTTILVYGRRFDHQASVERISGELQTAASDDDIVHIVNNTLTNIFDITKTGTWFKNGKETSFVVYAPPRPGVSDNTDVLDNINPISMWEKISKASSDKSGNLIFFDRLLTLHGNEWAAAIVLEEKDEIFGLVLLGPKVKGRLYQSDEIKLLALFGAWSSNIVIRHYLYERQIQIERTVVQVLEAQEEILRGEATASIHHRALNPLALLIGEAKRDRDKDILIAMVEQLIDDLRDLCRWQINPYEEQKSFLINLEEFMERQNQTIPITDIVDITVQTQLYIRGDVDEWQKLNNRQNYNLFYLTREAILNAIKAAKREIQHICITVTCHISEGQYYITVQDDGPGFNSKIVDSREKHRGLALMQAQAYGLQASFHIESTLDVGTTVSIIGPVTIEDSLTTTLLGDLEWMQ